ncbi:type VI secretion system protein IglI family protein [Chondromyces apiculatus]|uniref:ImpA N-terminal domain-containing protein n=1 Tax=Chondromyces apiculatus DSM 436 TaxID=1192034 RepID=A0A017T716_9BACT|nr:type VI secretion system protein IglI family protein [Chondromyces apiculatus]EYF05019.1 Hypothetical protein CAP_3609 [Chondromyces apiculatus DSM 436]
MARELAMFLEPIDVLPEPGLDAGDPRLAEMVSLAERDQYGAAADLAEEVTREGVHDVRALSFLLYQAFREGGLARVDLLFEVIVTSLGPNFEAFGPARRRAEHFNKRLSWLFDTMARALEYHQKHGTPEWGALREGLDPGALERVLQAGQRVAEALSADPYASAGQAFGRLMSFLRAHAEALAKAPAPGAVPAGGQPAPTSKEDGPSPSAPALASAGEDAAMPTPAGGAPQRRVEFMASHPLLELLAKLQAFEALVERGEMGKAAIVADDVQQLIEGFDPRLYFPEIFVRFSALLSDHIGLLSEHLEERDSVAWKARRQFYLVDLEGFVRG